MQPTDHDFIHAGRPRSRRLRHPLPPAPHEPRPDRVEQLLLGQEGGQGGQGHPARRETRPGRLGPVCGQEHREAEGQRARVETHGTCHDFLRNEKNIQITQVLKSFSRSFHFIPSCIYEIMSSRHAQRCDNSRSRTSSALSGQRYRGNGDGGGPDAERAAGEADEAAAAPGIRRAGSNPRSSGDARSERCHNPRPERSVCTAESEAEAAAAVGSDKLRCVVPDRPVAGTRQ